MKNGFIPPEAKKKQSFVPPEVKKKAPTDSPSTLDGGSSSLGSEGDSLDFLDKTFTPEDFGISTQEQADQTQVGKPTDATESPTAFIQPRLIQATELLQEVNKKEDEFIRNSEPYQEVQALEQQAESLLSEIQSYPKELPEDKLEVANQKIGQFNEIIERMDALSAQLQEIPNELGTNRERNKLLQEIAGVLSLAYPNEKLITGEVGVSMTEGDSGDVSEVDFTAVEDLKPTARFFEALSNEIGKELRSSEQILMEEKYGDMGGLKSAILTPFAAFNEQVDYLAKLPFLALGGTESEGYQFFNDLEKEQAAIKRAAKLSTMTEEDVDGGVTKNLTDGNYSAAAKNLGYDVLDGIGQVGSMMLAPNVGISRTGSMTLGRVSQDVLAKQPLFQGGRGIRAKARGVQQKIGEQGMNLGMVAMSGRVAEESYNEDIELGLHPLTATVAATVKGLAVIMSESIFTSDLAAFAGTQKGRLLADELIKNKGQVVRSYFKQIPREFAEKGAEEGFEELFEGLISGVVDYTTKGTPINPYQLADQALAGMGAGGTAGAGGALRTALSVQRTDAEQLKLQKRINKINNFLENNRDGLSQAQVSALNVELARLNPKLAKLVEARDAIFKEFSEEDTKEYLRLSQEIAQNLDALNQSGSERLDADTMGEVFDGLRESTKALLDERTAIEEKYMEGEEVSQPKSDETTTEEVTEEVVEEDVSFAEDEIEALEKEIEKEERKIRDRTQPKRKPRPKQVEQPDQRQPIFALNLIGQQMVNEDGELGTIKEENGGVIWESEDGTKVIDGGGAQNVDSVTIDDMRLSYPDTDITSPVQLTEGELSPEAQPRMNQARREELELMNEIEFEEAQEKAEREAEAFEAQLLEEIAKESGKERLVFTFNGQRYAVSTKPDGSHVVSKEGSNGKFSAETNSERRDDAIKEFEKIKEGKDAERLRLAEEMTKDFRKEQEDKVLAFLDTLIAKTSNRGRAFDATLGLPMFIANSSFKVVKAAYKAGKTLVDAIQDGIKYLKQQGYDVNEIEYKKAFLQEVKKLKQDATKEPSPTEVPVGEQPTTSQEVRGQDTKRQETPQEAKEQKAPPINDAVSEYRKRIQEGTAKPNDFSKAVRAIFENRKGKVTAKEAGSLAAAAAKVKTEKQLDAFKERATKLLDKAEKRNDLDLRKKKVKEIKAVFDSLRRKGSSLQAKVAPAQASKIKELRDGYLDVNLAELSETEFNDLYSLIMEYNEIGRANQKKINKLRNAENARMSGRMASAVMGQGTPISETKIDDEGVSKTKKLTGEDATKRALKIAARGGVVSVDGNFFYSKNKKEMEAVAEINPNFFDNAEVYFVPASIKFRKESLFQKMKSYVNLDFKTLLYKMSFTSEALDLMDEVYRQVAKGALLSGGVKQHYKVQEKEVRDRLLGKRGGGLHLLDLAKMDGEQVVVIAEGDEMVGLNNSQALQLYMLASRVNSQLDKVIGTIGEDGVMKVIEYVKSKPELLEYANSMFDLYSETLPAINEALGKLGQIPIERERIKSTKNEVKNRVITALFDGTPPALEPYAPADITSTSETDDSKLFMNKSGTNVKFYADSMKELTAGGVVTLTGVQENFVNYVDQISHMVAMADAYRMLGEVFNNGNMRIIKKKMGENFHDMLRDQINDIVAGRVVSQTTDKRVSNISNWARRQAAVQMFINWRSAIGQSLSSTNNIVEHQSVPGMLTYLGHFFRGIVSNKDRKEFASLDVVQRRKDEKGASEDFHDFIGNKKNISKAGELIDKVLSEGYFLTKGMDFNAVVISGAPYYRMILDDLKKQNPNTPLPELQEEAALKAMTVAEEVQQSSKIYTRSYLEKNALLRFLFTFQKVPLQYSRRVQQAFRDLRVGRGSATMNVIKIAYYGAIQNLMFGAFQMATKMIFKFEDEDDDEFNTRKKQQAATMLNNSLDAFLIGWGGWYGLAISKGKNVLYELAKTMAEANLEDSSQSSGRDSRGSSTAKETILLDPSAWEDLYRAITLMEEDQKIIKSGYRKGIKDAAIDMVPVASIMIRTIEKGQREASKGNIAGAFRNGVQAATGAPIAVGASRVNDVVQAVEIAQKANHAASIGDRFSQYAIALAKATNVLTEYEAKKAGIIEDEEKEPVSSRAGR